jgi:hypothetical protein
MLVKKRVILYGISFFFIVFISITMVFVLRGYYLDLSTLSIKKGGSVFVKSVPRTAQIYIDGKLKKKKSPINISLPSGYYTLQVKKDGFYSWEKKIKIDSGFVLWEEYVFLIRIDKQEKTLAENIDSFSVSKDYQKVAYSDIKGNIYTSDFNGDNKETIFENKELDKKITVLDWSKDNQSLLIKKDIDERNKQFLIIKKDKIISIPHIPGEISKINFKYDTNQELIALSSNRIYSVKENSILTEEVNVTDFSQTNSHILYTKNNEEESYVVRAGSDFKNKENIIKSNIKIIKVYSDINNFIAFIKEDSSLWTYLKDKEEKISDEADYATWSSEAEKLLFVRNGEIKVYTDKEEDPREPKIKLLTRLSSPADEIKWFYDEGHIMYRTKNKITFVEIDGSNSVNLTEKSSNIQGFSTTKYGRELIYSDGSDENNIKLIYSKIGEENGLIPY